MKLFIGRKHELTLLNNLSTSSARKGSASLVVIKGRRRIGKSRLAEEYAKDKIFIRFSGIPPVDGVTAEDQRKHFAAQFIDNFKVPPLDFSDWNIALLNLSYQLSQRPTVLLLDEISWMGSKDPTFIPKLKDWWDNNVGKFPNLMVILCGSISTWINENIINSTSFFGRISIIIDLPPLTIPESADFLRKIKFRGSSYEIYKTLSVTGGVPWYLEQIQGDELADENIHRLCFDKNGILTTEFDRIFHDLFYKKGDIYKNIIRELSKGMRTLIELRKALTYPNSGRFSLILEDLITAGFVTRHHQWSLKAKRINNSSLYRLSDNYTRFYLKYIEPNLLKIKTEKGERLKISQLPGWESMMGFQVENLILQNRSLLLKALRLNPTDIVVDNPYLQNKTIRHKGCQIDYLIQTHSNNLIVCEFKFKRLKIGMEIIDEMRDKLERFSKPRQYGIAPVLVHLGDISDRVYDSQYFYRIINLEDFLEGDSL